MSENERLRIIGGARLRGEVDVSGGKNAALAIIPAALLCSEPVTIENLPMIADVRVLVDALRFLGAVVEVNGSSMYIDPRNLTSCEPPYELVSRMRASYYLVSVLLGKYHQALVPFPGGCDIGARPIDLTIKGLETLGATITTEFGALRACADKLNGGEVYLDFPSVGATINTMLAATLAEGNTMIVNAAKEPHIVDTANFLNSMGAKIKGAGTNIIRIRGVERLHGSTYVIIPDQIETGTLMIAAAATCGEITVRGAIPAHMEALSAKLLEMGVRIKEHDDAITVISHGVRRGVSIKTQVYPGFPTDLQQPAAALLCTATGTSIITENVFEGRYKYIDELRRMGASVNVIERVAIIEGVPKLTGARVSAPDLRAGAALVIAGLMAEGTTEISQIKYLDRGYENLEHKLRVLGARIERIAE